MDDAPLPLPLALALLGILYGLPGVACWLAFRRRAKAWAVVMSAVSIAVTAYPAAVMFPRTRADLYFWTAVAGIPLIASIVAGLRAVGGCAKGKNA